MGSIYRQNGRRTWTLKYYQDGRAVRESTGTADKKKAATILKQREGAVADGKPVIPRAGRMRFDEAAADVVNDYRINGKRSIDCVERRIRLHLAPVFGGRRMMEISTVTIRTFIAGRQAATTRPDGTVIPGASNAEINRELAILKRAFSLAIKAGTLSAKPYVPMLAENNVRAGFFEREQYEAVLRRLPPTWRPVMTFAYLTGWRVRSEVLPLTWTQVDRDAQLIRLDVGTTKNDAGRAFPYGVLPELAAVMAGQDRARRALQKKGIICPFVFPDDAGGRLPAFYSQVWREACRLAGTPGKIPHDFRRTAVRNLVRASVPEKTAMLLTGHKTRSVFDRYDIVNEADLKAAVGRMAAMPKPRRRAR